MAPAIWYVSMYIAPPHGDAPGARGWELMRELAVLGHEVVVLTSDANHLAVVPEFAERVHREQRDGLQVCWLRTFKAAGGKSWRRIVSWLHFEWRLFRLDSSNLPAPDVVIVSSLSLLTVLNGLRLARRHRVRLVFEVRDIWPLTPVEYGAFPRGHPFIRALAHVERLGYRRADLIVGTMPRLVDHVREVLGEERQVRCIPMGYASRCVSAEARVPARSPDPSGHRLVVGYAGSIGTANALHVLFDAARLLHDQPEIRFRIIGDGPLLEQFKAKCADLPSVEFIPKVRKDQVPDELQNCDVLYLSTLPCRIWDYGQSLNKMIDYMLSGRPILASYSGYPSMLNEARSGFFVPAGDPKAVVQELRRFAAMDIDERARLGRRGRTWVLENRSYERLARDYQSILFPEQN